MPLVNILVGAALLLLGRRLFWLFVAGVGFVAGVQLATEFLRDQPQWLILVIGLVTGLVGALLSIFVQRLIAVIAGFMAGGYVLFTVALQFQYSAYAWIAFLVGGVIGALLVAALLDWALILLSSLMGAALIAQNVPLAPVGQEVLFVVLAIVGLAAQAGQYTGKPGEVRERRERES